MARTLKEYIHEAIAALRLVIAVPAFALAGRNADSALPAMIYLHGKTNGRTTRLLARLLGRPKLQGLTTSRTGTTPPFGIGEASVHADVCATLARDGYCVLPRKLDADAQAQIRAFAETVPADAWSDSGPTGNKLALRDISSATTKLAITGDQLMSLPAVQEIAACPELLALLQEHFGHMPILDSVGAWWSIAANRPGSAELAQQYHFDLDRPRWIKLFVYLTDVDPEGGPHVFVRGSHQVEARRATMLSRGYVRITDADVEATYGRDRVDEICGPAGTALLVETIGMHKGKSPTRTNRLILEFQFSSSLFGATYPKIHLPARLSPALLDAMKRYPQVYSQLVPAG